MERLLKFYINGEWVVPQSAETMPVLNPAAAERVAEVALGNEADVDLAVAAARRRSRTLVKPASLSDWHCCSAFALSASVALGARAGYAP